jgi:hypothetical protein
VHWDDPRIVITEMDKLFARAEQSAKPARMPAQPQPAK